MSHQLEAHDPPDADSLGEYQGLVEAFTARLTDDYTREIASRRPPKLKEFNDAIWKTVVLYPLEILILDSPLLQRLRWIRQLGVADYVFDAASHTRLQHAIGTLYVVDRLVASINESVEGEIVSHDQRRLLRLTALCHDIGHGAMSHVSDNAMTLVDRAEDLRLAFQAEHELDRQPSLSEIAAYYMLGSPSFGRLLAQAQDTTREHALPDGAPKLMQAAVVGLPIADEFPQLHELVSGPFDADKLDYMTRDSRMAGVPEVTDVPRLLRKARAIKVAPSAMPPEVAREIGGGLPSYVLMGIAHSGARTLDELMLGRMLLFDKIYRHHKVRALEAMVAAILVRLARITDQHPAILPLLFSDEQLLDITPASARVLTRRRLTKRQKSELAFASRLARMVKLRDVLVRCFAFSTRMPLDPYTRDPEQREGLFSLMRTVTAPEERRAFSLRVSEQVAAILALVEAGLLERYPPDEIHHWIWLDPPESAREANVVSRAYLITDDGRVVRYRDDYSESKAWTDAYVQARDVGYLFGPRPLSTYVYLAAERIVREDHGVRIPPLMLDYAKQERSEIDRVRRSLEARGYYATAPVDLRPMPHRLTRADVEQSLHEVAAHLAGYMGPVGEKGSDEKAPDDALIKPGRVRDFVRQFETNQLIDAALRAVSEIRLIGRSEVVAAVRDFLASRPDLARAWLCPLGSPKDSSFFNTYFALDAARPQGLRTATLEYALLRDEPIIFVDDFIGSGRQAVDILQAWLGVPRTGQLGEERDELPDDVKARLRARELVFLYAAGDVDAGAPRLRDEAGRLALRATVHVHIATSSLPHAFETVEYRNEGQRVAFERKCREIGRRLLRDATDRDDTWIEDRVLGYGNKALLVTFPYNTPTQTLTCLWASGGAGFPWLALTPRRKKL